MSDEEQQRSGSMDAISFGDDDEDWMEETAPREEEEQSVPPYDKEDGEAEDGEAAPEPDSQPAKAVSKTQDPKPQLGSIPVPSLKNEEQKPKPSSVAAAPVQHKTMAPVQRTPPSAAPPVPEDDGESSAEEGELVGESAGDYIEMVTKGSAHLSPHQFPRSAAPSNANYPRGHSGTTRRMMDGGVADVNRAGSASEGWQRPRVPPGPASNPGKGWEVMMPGRMTSTGQWMGPMVRFDAVGSGASNSGSPAPGSHCPMQRAVPATAVSGIPFGFSPGPMEPMRERMDAAVVGSGGSRVEDVVHGWTGDSLQPDKLHFLPHPPPPPPPQKVYPTPEPVKQEPAPPPLPPPSRATDIEDKEVTVKSERQSSVSPARDTVDRDKTKKKKKKHKEKEKHKERSKSREGKEKKQVAGERDAGKWPNADGDDHHREGRDEIGKRGGRDEIAKRGGRDEIGKREGRDEIERMRRRVDEREQREEKQRDRGEASREALTSAPQRSENNEEPGRQSHGWENRHEDRKRARRENKDLQGHWQDREGRDKAWDRDKVHHDDPDHDRARERERSARHIGQDPQKNEKHLDSRSGHDSSRGWDNHQGSNQEHERDQGKRYPYYGEQKGPAKNFEQRPRDQGSERGQEKYGDRPSRMDQEGDRGQGKHQERHPEPQKLIGEDKHQHRHAVRENEMAQGKSQDRHRDHLDRDREEYQGSKYHEQGRSRGHDRQGSVHGGQDANKGLDKRIERGHGWEKTHSGRGGNNAQWETTERRARGRQWETTGDDRRQELPREHGEGRPSRDLAGRNGSTWEQNGRDGRSKQGRHPDDTSRHEAKPRSSDFEDRRAARAARFAGA